MNGQLVDARRVSLALFNNAAFTEVLVAAHTILASQDGTVTTRQVAATTGRSDSVVRPVMRRLMSAGLLTDTGPDGTARPFARAEPELWRHLLNVVRTLETITDSPRSLTETDTQP